MKTRSQFVVCQIGAREHYAIARACHERGCLHTLFTDIWAPANGLVRHLPFSLGRKLRGRFSPALANAHVTHFSSASISLDALAALRRQTNPWPRLMQRNAWFQRKVTEALCRQDPRSDLAIFAYSYAAKEIFRLARSRGWRTILGQIDPGPKEEQIVSGLYASSPSQRHHWQAAPKTYWNDWEEECELADKIVVNSSWSLHALKQAGVAEGKLLVVPLFYDSPPEARQFIRHYPREFDAQRPMRVLFLGQINLRKGCGPLFEAIRLLRDHPIEFWFVGPQQLSVPDALQDNPKIIWTGPVPRNQIGSYYRDADLFILPSYSDGFGLTQIEAQAWKLPIVASEFCGEVVVDGKNGRILPAVSPQAIADILREVCRRGDLLANYSAASSSENFGIDRAGSYLEAVLS